ncbi:MAG: DUF2064 domain-containing protein [Bacteroidetes bacterium]|nr:DUF2064 domain-containing protein [Bacteroidota bacterium]MBU1485435.1 DUF2064 domain-containing protein [Bacteroidota bacterium]MBU2045372.1 DUF2064 domain-containing protein [Bacteroidota bacterium]MBU2269163.1 DUF2064 domain-containing protein [Bacteroidota bacterium]MBU2377252.1 DUF2064 domain-containing protein [Bacteroidota bacterium]
MTKTAIILFAHLPEFEARAKSMSAISSKKATQKISIALTQHFYTLATQTSADTFLIDSYHQKGKTFGERITNAFTEVYAKGYENVICIGNDCPELNLNQLQNAIFETEKGNVVLGPTRDGGAYLIGIPKNSFHSASFLNIKWQKRKTFKDLKSLYHSPITELELFTDLDSANAISAVNPKNTLIRFLHHIIQDFKLDLKVTITPFILDFFFVSRAFLKGPPLFA